MIIIEGSENANNQVDTNQNQPVSSQTQQVNNEREERR